MSFTDLTDAQRESLRGDPGPEGPKGEKGDKGDPGETYALTEADKTEICSKVLNVLPVWEGGSY
jgi:hypothetical protein